MLEGGVRYLGGVVVRGKGWVKSALLDRFLWACGYLAIIVGRNRKGG